MNKIQYFFLTVFLTGLLSASLLGDPKPTKILLKGMTTKDIPLYHTGEQIEFILELDCGETTPPEGYTITWTCEDDDGKTLKGTAPANETVHIQTVLARPGFVRLKARLLDASGKGVSKVSFDGGAGVDIDQIHGIPAPPDLEEFWQRQKEKLEKVPVVANYMTEVTANSDAVKIYAVSVACPGPAPVTGFLSIPRGALPGSLPAQLWFDGYTEARQPMMKDGPRERIVFWVNAHGYDLLKAHAPETGEEYHRQFMAATHSNGLSYGFDPQQNSNPETAYFNGMALRVMRALQFVKSLPEWNGKELSVVGSSQGGLQTIWAAALDHDVTVANATVPWCCNLAGNSCGRLAYDWGLPYVKELNYYDPVHLAPWIPKTCTLTIPRAGLGDYVCPPSGIAAFYNNLLCPKEIVYVQGSTHDYVPPYQHQSFTLKSPEKKN